MINNNKEEIEDLGDFTNKWTIDRELGDENYHLGFSLPEHVVKYILDNYHKVGKYQFSINGRTYQMQIHVSLQELIV